tara:strand:+ start:4361 stop:4684 length:324 start_codon:yes stop_codon:yes gene_type:complete
MSILNFFKTNNTTTKQVPTLRIPKNQRLEVFYLLLNHPEGLSRKDFMDMAYVMNAPNCVSILRRKGVSILTEDIQRVNKFGRPVTYCIYKIVDRKIAEVQYSALNKK